MSLPCTRCESTGFLNLHQVPDDVIERSEAADRFMAAILKWIHANSDHDVQICDCCGDGEDWHEEPGSHDQSQYGSNGPYSYNGGLPECY